VAWLELAPARAAEGLVAVSSAPPGRWLAPRTVAAIVLVSLGGALLATGAGLLAYDRSLGATRPGDTQRAAEQRNATISALNVATPVLLGTSGAAAVAGGLLFWSAIWQGRPAPVQVAPSPVDGGMLLQLGRSF
jgi:hypothetical protein